jgi:glutamine---fructose-6-phosphate transaminase (isomerizing)
LKSLNQRRESLNEFCNLIRQAGEVFITGSGTSYHSALLGRTILAKYANIRAKAIMSSEFQYSTAQLSGRSVLLAISQCGDTADLLQSVKLAKEKGAKIISIVNVPTSSFARLSDSFLEVKCGPEIGVAATKSFTS